MREARVAVTGSQGFIGSAVMARLAAGGIPATGLDRGELEAWPVQLAGAQAVIHLAGLSGGRHSWDDYQAANVVLAVNTLKAAQQAGVRRFVFVSSVNVHGPSSATPLAPDSPLATTQSLYPRSKAEAEQALIEAARGGPTALVIVRPPPVFGRGGRGAFAALTKAVAMGLPLPLGRARAPRGVLSARNLADALVLSAFSDATPPIFLPAEAEDHAVRDLVDMIGLGLGRPPRLVGVPTGLISLGASLLGKSAIHDTLFRPLAIDRAHWRGFWTPPHDTRSEIAEAVSLAR